MRLLYISYWGIDDALTSATVLPGIHILPRYFTRIFLATIERHGSDPRSRPTGFHHIPFYSLTWLPRFLQKGFDVVLFSARLLWLIKRNKIDVIICRGSSAALFGVLLHKVTGKDFIVESFEPHSDYMVEAGVWSKRSLEFRLQRWVEKQSSESAKYLLPVAYSFADVLISERVAPERVIVMPCCVNTKLFGFDSATRASMRKTMGIGDDVVVGIYVGKFGDIYLKEEAFDVFRHAFRVFDEKFYLIILTPEPRSEVQRNLVNAGFDLKYAHIDYVRQEEVPKFLSVSDFAFSLIRPSASRRYCSPIKNGEYWANGLPVLLTKGVGDDEQIILDHRAGIIIDFVNEEYDTPLRAMKKMLGEGRPSLESRIAPLARTHRGFEMIEKGYDLMFATGSLKTGGGR